MKTAIHMPRLGRVVLVASAMLFLAACQQEQKPQGAPPPLVGVAKPEQRPVTRYAEYTGATSAVQTVNIKPKVGGYLQEVKFTDGQMVKKGDLLFVIDPRPYKAAVDEAEGNLANARAAFELAKVTLARNEQALKDNAVSEIQVLQARASRDQAAAQIKTMEGALDSARVNLGYCYITAPVSGRISRRLVDVGNLVDDSSTLATLVSVDPMYAYFNVNERDLLAWQAARRTGKVQDGDRFDMALSSDGTDYPYSGKVDYIGNEVDPATGTVSVRGQLANAEGNILPGLFARVRLPVEHIDKALVVPEEAMNQDQRGDYLLVVKPDDTVEYRSVKKGALETRSVDGTPRQFRVIYEGISADDNVVVLGTQKARPGTRVTPKTLAELGKIQQEEQAKLMQAIEEKQSGASDKKD